jgi:phosphate/sulfate permease
MTQSSTMNTLARRRTELPLLGTVIFGAALGVGLLHVGTQLIGDLVEVRDASILPYLLLGLALFVALGFEFINGFHDTANAVATVIYTHSLSPLSRSSGPEAGISSVC